MNKFLEAFRFTVINLAALVAIVAIASLAGYGVGAIVTPPSEPTLVFVWVMFLLSIVVPGTLLSALSRSLVACTHKMFWFGLSHAALYALLYCWHISPQTPDMGSFLHLLIHVSLALKLTVLGMPLFYLIAIFTMICAGEGVEDD